MNNKERTQARRLFVMANIEVIEKLIKRVEADPSREYILPVFVQQWIEDIRTRAGYGHNISWRTIWFTLRKDYFAIKDGWTPQNLSLCDVLSFTSLYCYPCVASDNLLSRVRTKAGRLPYTVPVKF